jgi:small subunit ribosomal protein S8
MKGKYLACVKARGNTFSIYYMTDPIADLINRLKNASAVGKAVTTAPYSNMRHAIATKLQKKGILASVETRGEGARKYLEMEFARKENGTYNFSDVRRVSKPGCRVYTRASDIRPVKGGQGFALISTPKGILFHYEARKEKVGGEVLCEIW